MRVARGVAQAPRACLVLTPAEASVSPLPKSLSKSLPLHILVALLKSGPRRLARAPSESRHGCRQ